MNVYIVYPALAKCYQAQMFQNPGRIHDWARDVIPAGDPFSFQLLHSTYTLGRAHSHSRIASRKATLYHKLEYLFHRIRTPDPIPISCGHRIGGVLGRFASRIQTISNTLYT